MKKISAILFLIAFAAAGGQANAAWNYTALGDSLAYGTGVANGRGYVDAFKDHLESDNQTSVNLTNLGVPGWTSADLLSALKTNAIFRSAAAQADVITIDIGGNDLLRAVYLYKTGACGGKKNDKCLKSALKKLKSNWKKTFTQVRKLRGKKPTVIRTMNLYYSSVDMDRNHDSFPGDKYTSDFEYFNPALLKANRYLVSAARKKMILTADVHAIFNGSSGIEDPQAKGYISIDGLHPNETGYQIMADSLKGLGYSASK